MTIRVRLELPRGGAIVEAKPHAGVGGQGKVVSP